jgi:hypothetical protein
MLDRTHLATSGVFRMSRIFAALFALIAIAPSSRAEEAVVRLAVRPMRAPQPALKYQLLPELGELNPGNAAQNYMKCFMEQRIFFYSKEGAAERTRYQTLPLSELAAIKLAGYGGSALGQADWAARLDSLDWQDVSRVQGGRIERVPAELGPLQILAAALQARFRIEVAGRRFDDAIRTAKTMFALGRHLGEHSTEIADVIGLSAVHMGLGTLEEMVQQAGCPNLYWALTHLPSPLVDLRKGVQGDRTVVSAELALLRNDVPMTERELERFVGRISGVISFAREQSGQPPRNLRARLGTRVKDAERVRAARARLVAAGCAADVVKKLGPLQIILLDEKQTYEIERDDRIKLLTVPLWQIDSMAGTVEPTQDAQGLLADLLPHIVELRRTQGLLEQQIALLRHVEALRLHAADHGGKLPETLSEVAVPLPVDPFSGKPFLYAHQGATAQLCGSRIGCDGKGFQRQPNYEVTLLE